MTARGDLSRPARGAAERREALRGRIVQALAPVVEGEYLQRLARHLAAVMQGVSIQARDGVARADLYGIVKDVVACIATREPGD
ncbi:hypothetical protein [Methylobacterium oryzisoli]|uniref:hypothetical protein n=1 Tax=Methylobacterium oryzisoli TaxID=3385502 RepID=UPI0038927F63